MTSTRNLHKLSLPRNISVSENDDTFSRDLLRQFDKKRSRLHFELGFTSQEPSLESTSSSAAAVASPPHQSEYVDQEPIQLDDEIIQQTPTTSHRQYNTSNYSKRSSTSVASGLLKRSSAYLKSKFDLLKRTNNKEESMMDDIKPPTKLLMKTTISIPFTATTTTFSPLLTTTKPPTITQYPPKPLVYSPIEPITNTNTTDKPLLHRLSMPLMRVYNDTTSTSFGRRRKSEPDNNTKKKLKKTRH